MLKQSHLLALAEVLGVCVGLVLAIHYLLPDGWQPPHPVYWALAMPTTVAGFIFGLVREKTGSLYAAAACHGMGNVIPLFVGSG